MMLLPILGYFYIYTGHCALSALLSSLSISFLIPALGKMLHILTFQVIYSLNLLWREEPGISGIILFSNIEHLSALFEICPDSLIHLRIGHLRSLLMRIPLHGCRHFLTAIIEGLDKLLTRFTVQVQRLGNTGSLRLYKLLHVRAWSLTISRLFAIAWLLLQHSQTSSSHHEEACCHHILHFLYHNFIIFAYIFLFKHFYALLLHAEEYIVGIGSIHFLLLFSTQLVVCLIHGCHACHRCYLLRC